MSLAHFWPANLPPWAVEGRTRPRAVLMGSGERPNVIPGAEALRPHIVQHCEIVHEDFFYKRDLSQIDADLALVLGGDGSILRAVKLMDGRQLPIVGVNMGKLGFLAWLSPEQVEKALPEVAAGQCEIVDHMMFQVDVFRGEVRLFSQLALNEVVIQGGAPFRMLNIHLYVDGDLATVYSCDGLILSTPSGSTAYAMSAGGPILRTTLPAVVICPICPHALTMRPVVDAADRVYEMEVLDPNYGTAITIDGNLVGGESHVFEPGDRVRVTRAEHTFKLIATRSYNYYRTLREKLGWAGSLYRK